MRGLAIVSGLAITSVLSGAAYADCKHNLSRCDRTAVYACSERGLGNQEFIGGSDFGDEDQIALDKAADAGYDIRNCKKRRLFSQGR
jgi:hypothetical protein